MKTYDRSQLIASSLSASVPARIILLCASAGYGKSLALTTWLREQHDPSRLVRWVHGATEHDLSSIHRIVEETNEPLTLVIDDYDHLTTAEHDLELAELVARHPDLLMFVLARRVRILDGPLAGGRTQIEVINQRQLALTPSEVNEMLLTSNATDTPEMREALAMCHGWPLAVTALLSIDEQVSPFAALDGFTLSHRDLVSRADLGVLFTASLLDAITPELAAPAAGISLSEARSAAIKLASLGALITEPRGDRIEYRCHEAMRPPIARRARLMIRPDHLRTLIHSRAAEIRSSDPARAFKYYCDIEAYAEAELLLAQHFAVVLYSPYRTHEILRTLPDAILFEHPTFISTRLFLESADPLVPRELITLLTEMLRESAAARLRSPEDRAAHGELLLPTLCGAMFTARTSGNLEYAAELAQEIELTLTDASHTTRASPGLGSRSIYFREIALTALALGDTERSRRNWERLRVQAEAVLRRPKQTQLQSTIDVQAGRLTLLTAMCGLAFVEVIDGEMDSAIAALREADAISSVAGVTAPGPTWMVGELARAHLALQLGDEESFELALARIRPVQDRLEPWPLLLIAETESIRVRRGVSWALTHLLGTPPYENPPHQVRTIWSDILQLYLAKLYLLIGNFSAATPILETLPATCPPVMLERARLALFNGDDVQALLLAQSAVAGVMSNRDRTVRCFIAAVAAFSCGHLAEAFTAFGEGCKKLIDSKLFTELWNLPYEPLAQLAEAARDAGFTDYTELIDAVPESARVHRYEHLTEMELRTLETVAEIHGSTQDIAAAMHVTPATVKKHMNAVYRKLRVNGRDSAIVQATRMGLLPSREG